MHVGLRKGECDVALTPLSRPLLSIPPSPTRDLLFAIESHDLTACPPAIYQPGIALPRINSVRD